MLVTNNTLIENPDVFVEGDYYAVLIKTRDLVYEGYKLLTHPLFASIRMNFGPVRSLILSDEKKPIKENEYSMILIGESISKYQKLMENRKPDFAHLEDYEKIDFDLFMQAQRELKII
ncbi:MAG: hypothetical protein CR988_04370 [Treponema sp.]|nr:MAG: hypothetical protein CR988_04370 [Treponema sp.]